MATLKLEVVTPERTVVKEEVDMVICPGSEGEFGVLPHHVSLLSSLKTGSLRYRRQDTDNLVFISGGFVDVNGDACSVLAESAERAEDIDQARAEAAMERARKRLEERRDDLDETRAEAALRRAVTRLSIVEKGLG